MKAFRCIGLAIVLAAFSWTSLASGESALERIAVEREAKLADAVARLSALRGRIQKEQTALAQRLQDLDRQVREKEGQLAQAQRGRDGGAIELSALRGQVETQQRELDYIVDAALPEHFANFDAALSRGERAKYGEAIRAFNLSLEDTGATADDRLERSLDLARHSIRQIESVIGGKRYVGAAVDTGDQVVEGQFVQVGPLLYFSGPQGLAGWVGESDSTIASVTPLGSRFGEAIAEVAASGDGTLPIDPSVGEAIAISQTRDGVLGHLKKGGIWVYPILLFALAATVVAVLKIIQIYRLREPQPMAIHDLVKSLREGDKRRSLAIARAQPEPFRGMLEAAVDHADESVEMVEEVMYESMLTIQPRLERFLNVIAVTAAAAPLLGLLGTVTGIIKTFRLMSVFGAGDPKPLISGISEALITTELGLVLAIPALVLHAMLSRKVAGVMARLEKAAVALVNGLSRRTLAPPAA